MATGNSLSDKLTRRGRNAKSEDLDQSVRLQIALINVTPNTKVWPPFLGLEMTPLEKTPRNQSSLFGRCGLRGRGKHHNLQIMSVFRKQAGQPSTGRLQAESQSLSGQRSQRSFVGQGYTINDPALHTRLLQHTCYTITEDMRILSMRMAGKLNGSIR